jgi:hypothetical protein
LPAKIGTVPNFQARLLFAGSVAPFTGRLAPAAAAALMVAMAPATYAARPTRRFYPGVRPADRAADVRKRTPRLQRLRELFADYDNRVDRNEEMTASNGALPTPATIVVAGN